jgi:hypothetical protein
MRTITMTPTQVNVLKVLSKSPNGLTRKQLEEKVKAVMTTDIIGPTYAEDLHKHPDSLYGQGYVSPIADEDGLRWYITHEGRVTGERMRTRKPSFAVVPGNILDPVVIAFRPTRTYCFELYTDEDIQEIRSKLPSPYTQVLIPELRQQIVNRRKMGKYKTVTTHPEWYIAYRQGRHWTALVQEMTEHSNCVVNPTHNDGVNVYHRRFTKGGESVINQETSKDLIVLCESCRKKLGGSLPEVPPEMP